MSDETRANLFHISDSGGIHDWSDLHYRLAPDCFIEFIRLLAKVFLRPL
jgi:hypothetical protein